MSRRRRIGESFRYTHSQMKKASRLKSILFRLFAVVLGFFCALAVSEAAVRLIGPPARIGGRDFEWMHWDFEQARRVLVLDDEMGFRPRLRSEGGSDDALYSRFGTVLNSYTLEKSPSAERVLFMGDSVTFRGQIIKELERLYGQEGYEYWNAGVDSFNTRQEVEMYRRYNHLLEPDHVVLTFHVNSTSLRY